MARWLVALGLAVHGALHLLGFLHAWRLADVPLSGRTIVPLPAQAVRPVGLAWLAVALALLTAAGLRLASREWWWTLVPPALVVSQLLVVLQWPDAWAGTAVNVALALVVVVSGAIDRFHGQNRAAAERLFAEAGSHVDDVLRDAEVATLPPPVARWLRGSGAVGQPKARTVRLRQRGGLRTGPGRPYMRAAAEQYFTIDRPGFVWTVDVTMFGIPVVGRDSFVNGAGRMLIKAGGLVTVADGTGPTFDQGTALRFLGEIIWFPSAALARYIRWEAIDERRAQATFSDGGASVSAIWEFDDRGRVVRLTADRYYEGRSLERWEIPVTAWDTIRGIEMPARGGAVWKLATGDFDYYQWEIIDVEVNRPGLWE